MGKATPPAMKTTMLDGLGAFQAWTRENRLVFTVDDKFIRDHTMDVMTSKSNATAAAVERYTRDQRIKTSTWIMITRQEILDKVVGGGLGRYRAAIHPRGQQLAAYIKVKLRTVNITVHDNKNVGKSVLKNLVTVSVNGVESHLDCTSKDGVQDVSVKLVGPWDPVTGGVNLYHFETGELGQTPHTMLQEYLKWYKDEENNLVGPVAKK